MFTVADAYRCCHKLGIWKHLHSNTVHWNVPRKPEMMTDDCQCLKRSMHPCECHACGVYWDCYFAETRQTNTHTHAHTRARAHTHTHTHTRARARAHTHKNTNKHRRIQVNRHNCLPSHTRSQFPQKAPHPPSHTHPATQKTNCRKVT